MNAREPAQARLPALDLHQLRQHRARLSAEDDRISYWRRLTLARIDDLESGSHPRTDLSVDQLNRVLGDTATGRARRSIQLVVGQLPELPALSTDWAGSIKSSARAETVILLAAAHTALGVYEAALHDFMGQANRELIHRYRADPSLALDALPS